MHWVELVAAVLSFGRGSLAYSGDCFRPVMNYHHPFAFSGAFTIG